ncbi:MAG TPA: asparagine synthetase A [Candidatus Thermoplasmatota archaeon]|nr:asparagine synthetase A [Candidatus Thermoplasmatota archaeon]
MTNKSLEKKEAILKIQSELRKALGDKLRENNFIEISPVILSPVTDPLNHPTTPATIQCYGYDYSITQSMIFHKQLALRTLDKIFVFSPNVRLEQPEKQHTGRHLFEFTQLDVEVKNAKREDIMQLCETLLASTLTAIQKNCNHELHLLGRTLSIPKTPFTTITFQDAYERYGTDFEAMISEFHHEPVWLTDIPLEQREFYDKEDTSNPGYLRDMDLIYPEGYGEALSGGEREHEYDRIVQRILWKGQSLSKFTNYLDVAKTDLPPSAGFGIGIERLTRYVCGLQRIEDTTLFPKIPGEYCL